MRRATANLVHQVTSAGVTLRMGKAVTAEDVLAEKPDA